MSRKITPSLPSGQTKPTGKTLKTRAIVWFVLACIVLAVVLSVKTSYKNWPTPRPQPKTTAIVRKDACVEHLTQCQQEKMQLAIRIQETQNTQTQDLTFVLSMRLAQQLAAGKPFLSTLTKLKSIVPAQRELAEIETALSDYMRKGVPTQQDLEQQLEKLIKNQYVPEKQNMPSTWYDKTWAYIRTMVTIRPTNFTDCKTALCWLYKAQKELKKGNLSAALKSLEQAPIPDAAQLKEDFRARNFVSAYLSQFDAIKEGK